MYGARSFVRLLFLPLFHWSALVHDTPRLRGTMIRDRHEYNPSSLPRHSRRRHFAAATRNAIRIPLSWSCASYNVIVADTMMVVNTFQTSMASDMLHDNHFILRHSRGCMCGG